MIPETIRDIELEMRIDARPETVFSFFTESDKYRRWKGVDAEIDARPGGSYRVKMSERGTWITGEYLVVEPPERLVFTWGWESKVDLPQNLFVGPGSTRVEVRFIAEGDGTILRLRHEGFPTAGHAEFHTFGWNLYLPRLAIAVAGGDPGPDPVNAQGTALYS